MSLKFSGTIKRLEKQINIEWSMNIEWSHQTALSAFIVWCFILKTIKITVVA